MAARILRTWQYKRVLSAFQSQCRIEQRFKRYFNGHLGSTDRTKHRLYDTAFAAHRRFQKHAACIASGEPFDAIQEGNDIAVSLSRENEEWDSLASLLEEDATQLLLKMQELNISCCGQTNSQPFELSVELCDDEHISELNLEWRGKRGPTDVLSFEADSPPGYPMQLLGDVVISVETAARQAAERRHTLHDECRILLLHGVLHTLGYDHEVDEAGMLAMIAHEKALLAALGWQGSGLIASAGLERDLHKGERLEPSQAVPSSSTGPGDRGIESRPEKRQKAGGRANIKLLALDMDGTLLDSQSQVLPSSVEALHAALAAGVIVCLATGKARPAAMAAMGKVGLAGQDLVVSKQGPGLFLQGLAVHGYDGTLLEGPDLSPAVIKSAFQYASEKDIPLAAFLGDDCATLKMHPELEELHFRYYEPLCREEESLEKLLSGPPIKKLLFMTDADKIAAEHQPYWMSAAKDLGADTTMAVPNMLEILPKGINKWVGMEFLLEDLQIDRESLMSCGDGSNDLQLVANSGLGIAMGNAVPAVKEAAKVVVSSNNDGGIAEAIERFIL